MQYLTTMYDNLLNAEYDLYRVNAKLLKSILLKTYRLNLIRLQTFNEELPLSENITDIRAMLAGKKDKNEKSELYGIHVIRKKCKEQIQSILANNYVTVAHQTFAEFGIELMPFSVSAQGKNLESSRVELLDGFRRMFFNREVPDTDVLVKVYDKLDDRLFINAMLVFNSWKFKNDKSSLSYIDRGFRLGLYFRYGIDFTKLYSSYWDSIWSLIDVYTAKRPYASLWNNHRFHEDILVINEMSNYLPLFKVTTKRKHEEYDSSNLQYFRVEYFMEKILKEFISILGKIRREEFLQEKKNVLFDERKAFSLQLFKDYLSREELQPNFLKMSKMTVGGFIDNYFIDHLIKDMRQFICGKYGIVMDFEKSHRERMNEIEEKRRSQKIEVNQVKI